jgi:uncharacterized membrane protein
MQEFFANDIVKTFLIAMAPIGELRVSLPLALTKFNMSLPLAFFFSVIGFMLPVMFIGYFKWFFTWLFHYTRKKHSKRFEVLEEIALVTFVAIPLPMTGAWSGALAAFVFGIPPKKSLPLITLGVIGAGIIVTIITLGLKAII